MKRAGLGIKKKLSKLVDMRNLNESFEDDEFENLEEVKGDRTWHDAILEEFGVKDSGSRMQEHLSGLDVEEVKDYVETILSDDTIYEWLGGPEAFLDAVEEAEKAGENREDVLELVEEKRQGEIQQ